MGVPEYASQYDLIVVMPDVGNSWYVNWAESEGGEKNDWEDYITKDLIGFVDGSVVVTSFQIALCFLESDFLPDQSLAAGKITLVQPHGETQASLEGCIVWRDIRTPVAIPFFQAE